MVRWDFQLGFISCRDSTVYVGALQVHAGRRLSTLVMSSINDHVIMHSGLCQ